MNDRELLELAAKAAGVSHVDYSGVDYDGSLGLIMVDSNGRHVAAWSPLEDDGDALRLAVKLHMSVNMFFGGCEVDYDDMNGGQGYLRQDGGPSGDMGDSKVMRRAIVRAAAEIGKAMP